MSHAIRPNAFTENLGSDVVAVDDSGRVLCRTHDLATAMRAAPAAKAYLTANDITEAGATPAPEGLGMSPVGAELKLPKEIVDAEAAKAVETAPTPAAKPVADGSAFDHDGDGHVGGSKPRAKRVSTSRPAPSPPGRKK